MDHKSSWPWKKKPTEKTIIADDKSNLSSTKDENETLVDPKAQLERDLKLLNEKLSSALAECMHKDDFAKKQAKIAQEAIAGWEKTETEALSLKQELDKALQQVVSSEERLVRLDAALKECMQQLRFVREEQEKRIHDAVMKTSKEYENSRISLDQKLAEARRRVSRLESEKNQLSKALLTKEKVIEELRNLRAQTEADLGSLITRVESTEKENASLKYEVRVLEKELEIRNEEREFNRRTADVAHKLHLESAKKIANLEAECQRLRVLVRKRLPGPGALAKMKNEVEMLGKGQSERRRRNSSPSSIEPADFSADEAPDTPIRKINFLTEQLCLLEEENRNLQEALNKRMNELQNSAAMQRKEASSLSLVGHLVDNGTQQQYKNSSAINGKEMSLASISDMGSDDKASCADSWTSALISDQEQLKNGKAVQTPISRSVGSSDISLMDDFVEMEKLAVVSAKSPYGIKDYVAENDATLNPLKMQASENVAGVATSDLYKIPVPNLPNGLKRVPIDHAPSSFESLLKMVLQQSQVLQLKPVEVLDEIKAALQQSVCPDSQQHDIKESMGNDIAVSAEKHKSEVSLQKGVKEDISDKEVSINIYRPKKISPKLQPNMGKSIHKIVELIAGITIPPLDDCNAHMSSRKDDTFLQYESAENPTGYVERVFQWKASELSSTLKRFVQSCHDLLNGKSDLESFTEQLASTLEWIMNHCFSLQDVSSMKDAIRNYLDWDDSRSESEIDSVTVNPISESNKLTFQKEEIFSFTLSSLSNVCNSDSVVKEVGPSAKEEIATVKSESPSNVSAKHDVEERCQSEVLKSEPHNFEQQESHKAVDSLQMEADIIEHMKEKATHPYEKHQRLNEYLDTQLSMPNNELKESGDKMSVVNELDSKEHSRQQLGQTSHDMPLPQQSMNSKGCSDDVMDNKKELRTDWEIVAASEKLAECQETILNLGKQLKALASPHEAALFDKVISSPAHETLVATLTTPEKIRPRTSLLDKMLAEDETESKDFDSQKTEVHMLDAKSYPAAFAPNKTTEVLETISSPNRVISPPKDETATGYMAIIPSKKRRNGGLLKKLLRMRKTGGC
ncbi:OLC1v1010174C1 [Oldenlandia corymbosa var. corymbosa]|uniref:OLC1v1010174C1 n=1 Tax=Oldenlandia corymbosa var. corymbosa TaxID=529605 RepID=A0AAV1DQQ4_OLDCO|nr:OLC1v1010174C1 [Oldenlandia corymbosa var. corymbosa]